MEHRVAGTPGEAARTDFWSHLRAIVPTAESRPVLAADKLAQLDAGPTPPVTARLRILRNFAAETLAPWLRWQAYQTGVRLQVEFADFGVLHQEILDPQSSLLQCPPEAAALALWLDGFRSDSGAGTAEDLCNQAWEMWRELTNAWGERLTVPLLVNTFLPPWGLTHQSRAWDAWRELNQRIRASARATPHLLLVDVAAGAERLGWEAATDPRLWHLYRMPLTNALAADWAAEAAQQLAVRQGRMRKVLVLDADDTLWGGIVGEDGLAGIRLGPQRYPDLEYFALQRQLLELHEQGVLLALCSRNNPEDVREVFERHPHSLLKWDHFAAVRVNWQDKAANLGALSQELRLSLDQFVFLDDSPTERARVRDSFPEVDVLAVPAGGVGLTRLLADYRGFAAGSVTPADRDRTAAYRAERDRESQRAAFPTVDEFLASLQLTVEISGPREEDWSRVAQLVERTNQFNLTTRRHSLAELRRLADSNDHLLVALRARDKFGDYGLTGLAIAHRDPTGEAVEIDTFLMSCRVLGRRLEQAFLAVFLSMIGQRWPVCPIRAEYRQTAKNSQVADFWDRHGFGRQREQDGAESPERVRYAAPRGHRVEIPEVVRVAAGPA